jgi:hypothetical protein
MTEAINKVEAAPQAVGPAAKLLALYAYGSDEAYAGADKLTCGTIEETTKWLKVPEAAKWAEVVQKWWLDQIKKHAGEEEAEDFKRIWAEAWVKAKAKPEEPAPAEEVLPKARERLLQGVRSWDEVVVPEGVSELEALTYVPGLVGDIVEWIVKGAPRPNRMMALGVAVTIVGTLIGRWIEGPGGCATHLYIVILAPSGFGKDWPLHCGEQLMLAAGAGELVGPGEFVSSGGFLRHLSNHPLIVCFVDELGDELSLITNQKGNDFVTKVVGALKKCWNAWATIRTGAKVHEDSVTIVWPAPSLIGAATPQRFFDTLDAKDLESGFANRMLILPFERAQRPPEQESPRGADEPPKELVEALKRLPRQGLLGVPILDKQMGEPPLPKREAMPWGEGASEVYLTFSKKMDQIGQTNENHYNLSVRSTETAKRLATNIAKGRGSQTVDRKDIERGIKIAYSGFEAAVGGYARYMRKYFEFPEFCEEVLQKLAEFGGFRTIRNLERDFRSNKKFGKELDAVFRQLLVEERIASASQGGTRGPSGKGYKLVKDGE